MKTKLDYSRMKIQFAPFSYIFSGLLSVSVLINTYIKRIGRQNNIKGNSSLSDVNNLSCY